MERCSNERSRSPDLKMGAGFEPGSILNYIITIYGDKRNSTRESFPVQSEVILQDIYPHLAI